MQIPWLFPDFSQYSFFPWPSTKFPDFCQVWNFPDFYLTTGHPAHPFSLSQLWCNIKCFYTIIRHNVVKHYSSNSWSAFLNQLTRVLFELFRKYIKSARSFPLMSLADKDASQILIRCLCYLYDQGKCPIISENFSLSCSTYPQNKQTKDHKNKTTTERWKKNHGNGNHYYLYIYIYIHEIIYRLYRLTNLNYYHCIYIYIYIW